MSLDWKRTVKALAGMMVAGALCVGGASVAMPAVAANGGTATDTGATEPVAAGCDAVLDWAKLKSCVESGSSVLLAGLVAADADGTIAADTITVKAAANVSIGVKDGVDEAQAGITGTKTDGKAVRMRTKPVFTVPSGAALTFNGGMYKDLTWNVTSEYNSDDNGGLVFSAGEVTVKGGTFDGNSTNAPGGGAVLYQKEGAAVIDGGTFESNKATWAGGAGWGASVISMRAGSLTIHDGTFQDNSSAIARGGAIFQNAGSTTITGGTFKGNSAVAPDPAKGYAGGGFLYAGSGSVDITGGTFTGNHANASAYGDGGGVLYVKGKLTIANGQDVNGNTVKPTFKNNWESVDETYPGALDGNGKLTGTKIGHGGAGGAIFLQGVGGDTDATRSYGYFLGGVFEGNMSGYLGGAIYTEEYTVSYVGPAAATQNTAGHFGGGLWFCPSGQSEASKSGNIALKDNSVDSRIDGNTANKTSESAPTEAGSDLAIMNPYAKSKWGVVHDNAFQLLDTWFTDRGTKTVDWYWDGQPRTTSSGYADEWQAGNGGEGVNAVRAYKTDGSDQYDDSDAAKNAGGATEKDAGKTKRYSATASDADQSTKETGTMLTQHWIWNGDKNTNTDEANQKSGNTYGGIGLKAVLNEAGQAKWQSAWDTAKVTFQHNGARLSGGAFGSNGRVILSTPYSASWNKVGNTDQHKTLKGSSWRVSTTKPNSGMPVNNDRLGYDAGCPANASDDYKDKGCWSHRDGDADGWVSIIVTDNDARDNNPADGEFSIDNLKPDVTYELQEETAPAGYQKSDAVYQFTTSSTQTVAPAITVKPGSGNGQVVDDDHDGTARGIVNTALPGLHWNKVDADTNALLGGSTWTITKIDDPTWSKDIADCEAADCKADGGNLLDVDTVSGQFEVKDLEAGSYTLKEKTAPSGYWLSGATYSFKVVANSADPIKLTKQGEEDPLTVNQIGDEAMGVQWTKVGDDHTLLAGSEWTITYPDTVKDDKGNVKTIHVTDCTTSDQCSGTNDSDKDQGKFKVIGLVAGTYKLTETKAPTDYKLPDGVTYAFTIEAGAHTIMDVAITGTGADGKDVSDNQIVNLKTPISNLPFTGGRSGLDWLIIGGGLALAAAAAALATGRVCRHEL